VTTPVAATGAIQPLKVVPGRTSWLRITIAGARRVHLGYPGAGISDVLIPGVRVTRLLQPAQDPAGRQAASAVYSFHQQVPSPSALADPVATAPMARTFTLAAPVTLHPQASALAVPGPGLDALLGKIGPPGPGLLQVSVAGNPAAEPAGFPASLISGSGSMPWTAESASPVIHLSWHGQRRIGSLIVRPARGLPSTPQTVQITSPDGTRQASIGAGGLVRFPAPLTTDRIDVSFPRVRQATIVTATGQLATLPVRLSQLSVPALADLRAVTPDQQARFTLACGQGPALTVDGRVYQTSVSGTDGELSGYLPLPVRVCSPGGTLSFGAGRHTLTAATPGTFAVTDLTLASIAPGPKTATAAGASRAVTVRSWQPDQRQISIGPGVASYLVMHGNFNPGWDAALNGHVLTPVRLDGWQQGFIVPAGPGGTITLSFRPAAAYHLALAVSLVAAAILLAVAAWSFIGRPRRGEERDPDSGQAGREAWSPLEVASGGRRAWLGVLGVTALIFVAGGLVALAVPVLAYLAWRLSRAPRRTSPGTWLPWVAFGGMVASGLLSAVRPFGGGLLGSFGGPAQACALIALAAALTPAVTASGPAREGRQPAITTPAITTPTITTGEDDT
jgi:arabinofuranan 3-O-arabinosyltransferase